MWFLFSLILATWAKVPISARVLLFILVASLIADVVLGYFSHEAKASVICSAIGSFIG